MKKLAFIFATVFVAGTFASCRTCVDCTYTDNTGTTQTAESCGNDNNDDLEADLNQTWGNYGPVTCTED